jgi:hypothetical protein
MHLVTALQRGEHGGRSDQQSGWTRHLDILCMILCKAFTCNDLLIGFDGRHEE